MKKIVITLFLNFFLFNLASGKILNVENKVLLDVPSSHNFIKYREEEVVDAFSDLIDTYEDLKIDAYVVGPSKYIELERAILDGEDPMENKYVKSIVKKLEKKNFQNEVKAMNWMISEAKKIMRKEKVDFITYVMVFSKNLKDLLIEGDEFDDIALELYSMNNSELLEKTKELKKIISSLDGANSKTYYFGAASIEYSKLKLKKNEYDQLILKGPSKVTYAVNDTLTLKASTNILLGSHVDKTYLLFSVCYVDCTKFNSKFNKLIKPIFTTSSKKINQIGTSSDTNLVDQIKSLSDLYKSGVLTEEEFKKAKKKILN